MYVLQVCEGEKVVIDVLNGMEGMEVTIHWHGIWQRGSQYSAGVPFVTQCPIQQGNTFRYQWIAGNAGTLFWHAHTGTFHLNSQKVGEINTLKA
jgi:FtsP/CotA-like multicopper oxidase with cupredoxin domain